MSKKEAKKTPCDSCGWANGPKCQHPSKRFDLKSVFYNTIGDGYPLHGGKGCELMNVPTPGLDDTKWPGRKLWFLEYERVG